MKFNMKWKLVYIPGKHKWQSINCAVSRHDRELGDALIQLSEWSRFCWRYKSCNSGQGLPRKDAFLTPTLVTLGKQWKNRFDLLKKNVSDGKTKVRDESKANTCNRWSVIYFYLLQCSSYWELLSVKKNQCMVCIWVSLPSPFLGIF